MNALIQRGVAVRWAEAPTASRPSGVSCSKSVIVQADAAAMKAAVNATKAARARCCFTFHSLNEFGKRRIH